MSAAPETAFRVFPLQRVQTPQVQLTHYLADLRTRITNSLAQEGPHLLHVAARPRLGDPAQFPHQAGETTGPRSVNGDNRGKRFRLESRKATKRFGVLEQLLLSTLALTDRSRGSASLAVGASLSTSEEALP